MEEDNALGTVFVDSSEQGTSVPQSPSREGLSSGEDEEEKVLSQGKEEITGEGEQSTPRHDQGIQENPSHEKDLCTTVRRRRDEDRKKGKAVTKQLVGLIGWRGVPSLQTRFMRYLETLGQSAGCPDTFTKISYSVKSTPFCEFCKTSILLIPFDTPMVC